MSRSPFYFSAQNCFVYLSSTILFMFVPLTTDGRLCFVYSFIFNSMLVSCDDQRVFKELLFVFLFSFRLKPAHYLFMYTSMHSYELCFWYENSERKNECPWLEVIHVRNITLSHTFVEYKLNSIPQVPPNRFSFVFVWACEYKLRTVNRH